MFEEEQIKKNFGNTLKELRISKNLTQEKLAELLNLDSHTISTIETGKAFTTCESLTTFCNFFKVDPTIFFVKKVRVSSEENLNCIKDIKQMLPCFNTTQLRLIRNFLLILQK